MLHPYRGNVSLISDAYKLIELQGYSRKALFMIGYEHNPPKISLDPLVDSFELIINQVVGIPTKNRIEAGELD
jgi:hypothetical protein